MLNTKDFNNMFPKLEPLKLNKDHLDIAIEQATIMKNYWSMTEMYLKLIKTNLDFWHSAFILEKDKEEKNEYRGLSGRKRP